MKAPEGKAEIWVYRRNVNERIERVPVGTVPITTTVFGTDGQAHQQTVAEETKYSNLYQATEETVQLLMFNDHYLTQKTTSRQIKHFN